MCFQQTQCLQQPQVVQIVAEGAIDGQGLECLNDARLRAMSQFGHLFQPELRRQVDVARFQLALNDDEQFLIGACIIFVKQFFPLVDVVPTTNILLPLSLTLFNLSADSLVNM